MTDPSLSMDPAVMVAQAAEVRVPSKPRVSEQIGCSDLAPLLVGWGNARRGSDWRDFPAPIREWLETAAQRAQRWSEKPVPQHLKGMPAVWCAERARLVRTPAGAVPEIVAIKAGLRERAAQTDYQAAGNRLEAALWRRWLEVEAEVGWSRYALADVPEHLAGVWTAPKARMTDAPLITYPDGWGETRWGESFVINCKTTRDPKDQPDPPAWIQVQGEMAVMDADKAVLPHGIGWNADDSYARYMDWHPDPTQRPVRVFWVERDVAVGRALVEFSKRAMDWIHEVARKGNGA